MLWNKIPIILAIELVCGFVLGKVLIPYFRKLKTGKLEIYIGDRFQKDDGTPKFGGVLIAICLGLGLFLGMSVISSAYELGDEPVARRYVCAFVYALFLMIIGLYEDYHKERGGKVLGLKLRHKVFGEFLLSLGFVIMLYIQGDYTCEVLLPFNWGYIDFGVLYYPLMALFMTIFVNLVKVTDCFGGDTKSSCDGLCAMTAVVFSLIMAVCCNVLGDNGGQIYAYCIAGAVAGFLIWGLSPAKLYLGESGSLLIGGLLGSLVIISHIHIAFFVIAIAFVADGICSAVQYVVYKKSKKLMFKGNSLHAHLSAKGWGDYKIIALFSLLTIAGGAGAIAFSVYMTKF